MIWGEFRGDLGRGFWGSQGFRDPGEFEEFWGERRRNSGGFGAGFWIPGVLGLGGFGILEVWGFGVPLPCASPPEVSTAMALPAPRVSGCRAPAGLGGIFLPAKNREIRANPKAGRAALSPRVALPAQSDTAGGGTGDRDMGTAPLPPPGHSRWGGHWGAPYWDRFVPRYWSQSLFPIGASLSLLVPVLCPQQSQSLLYWDQSVLTGPSSCSQWELLCLTGSSLSLLVPVCILCGYWSVLLTSASLFLLVPVHIPSGSCCALLTGASLSSFTGPSPSLAVAVCVPCGTRSALLTGTRPLSLLVPVSVPCLSRLQFGAGPGPRGSLAQSPVPGGSTDLRGAAGPGRGTAGTAGGGESRPRRARPGPGAGPAPGTAPGTAGPPPWPGDSATIARGQRGDTGWGLGLAAGSGVTGSG